MKHKLFSIIVVAILCLVATAASAHDIAVQNANGETNYYVWANNNTELSVSYRGSSYDDYSNEFSGSVVIPEIVEIGDADGQSVRPVYVEKTNDIRDSEGFKYINDFTYVGDMSDYAGSGSYCYFTNCSQHEDGNIIKANVFCVENFYGVSEGQSYATFPIYLNKEATTKLGEFNFCWGFYKVAFFVVYGESGPTFSSDSSKDMNYDFTEAYNTMEIGESKQLVYVDGTVYTFTVLDKIESNSNSGKKLVFSVDKPLYFGGNNNGSAGIARFSNRVQIKYLANFQREEQSLELSTLPNMTYGDEAYTLPEKTNEGLDITWTIGDANVASINSNVLTINGAGTTTVTATQAGNDSYNLFSRQFTLTVNKAPLTVTAQSYTITQGDPLPTFEVIYSGFQNGEDESVLDPLPTISCSATSSSAPGTYDIIVSGGSAANYAFAYVNGTLTIMESGEVMDDTDISLLDNVIYVERTEAFVGCDVTLSVKMKNSAAIRGFQFDLYLPEGVTIAKNNKGKFITSLSAGRLDDDDEHTLSASQQSDGSYRFLCGSLYEETFLGNDGVIATMTLNISENMEEGDYPLYLRNIKLTENNISKHYETAEVKTTLTISNYILGDINGDGKVDVSDYIGIANRILGNTPEGFNEKAADVDENGVIDVSDYIGVANIILTGSIYGSQQQSRISRHGVIE